MVRKNEERHDGMFHHQRANDNADCCSRAVRSFSLLSIAVTLYMTIRTTIPMCPMRYRVRLRIHTGVYFEQPPAVVVLVLVGKQGSISDFRLINTNDVSDMLSVIVMAEVEHSP
jgi:hypothetical protein